MTADVVTIVDDDDLVLRTLARVLKQAGYQVRPFRSADELLAAAPVPPGRACLVLDQSMPGLTGLELQARLESLRDVMPIVFLTGHASVATSVTAMKGGAVDFLEKPVDESTLLAAVGQALERSAAGQAKQADRGEAQEFLARWATLTPREAEVCVLVTRGLLNKQIAGELSISEKTVKTHRGRAMVKLAVGSVAELVKLTERTGCTSPPAA